MITDKYKDTFLSIIKMHFIKCNERREIADYCMQPRNSRSDFKPPVNRYLILVEEFEYP